MTQKVRMDMIPYREIEGTVSTLLYLGDDDAIDDMELDQLWEVFHQHNMVFLLLGRKTLEQAWCAGDTLIRIKQKLPHGTWLDALAEQGIANQTANRYMRLRQGFVQIPQNGEFDTIQQALEYLKAQQEDAFDQNSSSSTIEAEPEQDSNSPDTDSDTSWEHMRKSYLAARKGLESCRDDAEQVSMAGLLIGWLMEDAPVRTAILHAARQYDQNKNVEGLIQDDE